MNHKHLIFIRDLYMFRIYGRGSAGVKVRVFFKCIFSAIIFMHKLYVIQDDSIRIISLGTVILINIKTQIEIIPD